MCISVEKIWVWRQNFHGDQTLLKIDENFLVAIPFKHKKLRNKKLLIAYYKNNIKTYKIIKNKDYNYNKLKIDASEKAFLDNTNLLFKLAYKNKTITKYFDNCNPRILFHDYSTCNIAYENPCTGDIWIVSTLGKGETCGGELDEVVLDVPSDDDSGTTTTDPYEPTDWSYEDPIHDLPYTSLDDLEFLLDIPPYIDDKINNNLTNPCGKNIFTELENGIYKDHPLKPEIQILNEDITELNFSEAILKLFNDSDKTNYTIQNGNLSGTNASTIGATTTISNNYLQNATKLSIARTMIHESVHAYLNSVFYGRSDIANKPLQDKLRQFAIDNGYSDLNRFHHEFMGQYIEGMAYSLYEWDKNYGESGGTLGWDYYYAMAFGGLYYKDASGNLIETDSFKALVTNQSDRDKIKKILENEQNGNSNAKGTKCN